MSGRFNAVAYSRKAKMLSENTITLSFLKFALKRQVLYCSAKNNNNDDDDDVKEEEKDDKETEEEKDSDLGKIVEVEDLEKEIDK